MAMYINTLEYISDVILYMMCPVNSKIKWHVCMQLHVHQSDADILW